MTHNNVARRLLGTIRDGKYILLASAVERASYALFQIALARRATTEEYGYLASILAAAFIA
ncbi:MAG: hypothetical protein GF419_10550, partial [Ignavibacteriales bacterium]|nr:hypothetical protein [Ignavibacteriales bacterium]